MKIVSRHTDLISKRLVRRMVGDKGWADARSAQPSSCSPPSRQCHGCFEVCQRCNYLRQRGSSP